MLVLRPRHVQLWYYAGKRGTASAVDQIIVDHHIPVEPGHILSINAQHAVDIDVQQGSHEHIDLQAPTGTQVNTSNPKQTDVHTDHCSSDSTFITARVPERYVGLQLHSHGGNVTVQRITEAPVDINTRGGSLDLGSIKATTAVVRSHGGSVSGSVTGATVQVHSGGGTVDLKRLVGNTAVVRSDGADVAVRAAYAQALDIDTGGAAARLGIVDCGTDSTGLQLHTHGGAVRVDALDGTASIHTDGGPIDVHCAERVDHVLLHSNNGRIRVSIAHGMRCRLIVQAARLSLGQGIRLAGVDKQEAQGGRLGASWGQPGRLEAVVRGADAQGGVVQVGPGDDHASDAAQGLVHVDAGSRGEVELVTKSSWFSHALQFGKAL